MGCACCWNDAKKVVGLQYGILYSTVEQALGLQMGLWNEAGKAVGLQFGLRNVADRVYFFQIGAANTATAAAYGFQISPIYNRASKLYGIQIGLINVVTRSLNGIQIGLLNISRGSGGLTYAPLINNDGLVKTQTAPFADRLRCWGVPAGKSRNWSKIQEHRA